MGKIILDQKGCIELSSFKVLMYIYYLHTVRMYVRRIDVTFISFHSGEKCRRRSIHAKKNSVYLVKIIEHIVRRINKAR